MKPVIVDTNIVFSALVDKNSKIATFLLRSEQPLLMPKYGFVKLFKYKAWVLVKEVDSKDLLFVALTIEMGGLLWTGDKQLRMGLDAALMRSFYRPMTPEILQRINRYLALKLSVILATSNTKSPSKQKS